MTAASSAKLLLATCAASLICVNAGAAEPPATICEYDPSSAGGAAGGQGATVGQAAHASVGQVRRQTVEFYVERLQKIDFNRDGRLTGDELSALGIARLRRLLQQHDTNRDGQLTPDELAAVPREPVREASPPSAYAYAYEQPSDEAALEDWQYGYLRKMSWLARPTNPQPRRQPFARAAVFGTGPRAVVVPKPVTSVDARLNFLSVGRCN